MNRHQRRAAGKQGQPARNPGTARGSLPPAIAELLAQGIAHHQAGRLPLAETCYWEVLANHPSADAAHLLGVIAHQVGRHDIAVDLIRRAIARDPGNPAFFTNLGNTLRDQGKLDEAVAAFRDAIRIDPSFAAAYCNLGTVFAAQGKRVEAVAAYEHAICIEPGSLEAHSNLGAILYDLGRFDEAIAACRQVIRIKPDEANAHCNIATAFYHQGKLDEAVASYREAINIKPDYPTACCGLGAALYDRGKVDDAVAAYRQAIRLKPDYSDAHCNLATALYYQDHFGEAVAACREAIRIKPDFARAHCNLGAALSAQGQFDQAVAAYGEAIALKPDFAPASSGLLMCLNYDDGVSASQLFDMHRDWQERHGRAGFGPAVHANDRALERRLKVGYVSPDFRSHSVAHFLEPLLRSHDRNEIEVFCYAEVSSPDAWTERFRQLADHWVTTVAVPDEALAERIRRDGIDILVDLAGHTAKNRLLVFARKPAPVQLTWLGYPNTTGLDAIDYRLVDAVTDPEGEADALASETLVRLPGGFLCYAALDDADTPAPPPCLAVGTVTFGSFNNPEKLSAATLDAWAMLLARLSDARLLLKGKPFADAVARASLLDRLRERGVAADRVDLMTWLPDQAAHRALYDRVDIALDPFPYNGTTTTCEALWMGVPVVALRGDRHAGRVGASLLTQIGLNDLLADSVEEYVEIAAALARDPARLADLRRSLRPRMAASELCDAPGFARKVEAAYRAMWQRWCAASNSEQS